MFNLKFLSLGTLIMSTAAYDGGRPTFGWIFTKDHVSILDAKVVKPIFGNEDAKVRGGWGVVTQNSRAMPTTQSTQAHQVPVHNDYTS